MALLFVTMGVQLCMRVWDLPVRLTGDVGKDGCQKCALYLCIFVSLLERMAAENVSCIFVSLFFAC